MARTSTATTLTPQEWEQAQEEVAELGFTFPEFAVAEELDASAEHIRSIAGKYIIDRLQPKHTSQLSGNAREFVRFMRRRYADPREQGWPDANDIIKLLEQVRDQQ